MKKLFAGLLALVTIISAAAMTVSAADHTDETETEIETASVEMIGPEEALEIMNDRLGYETGYSLVQWGPDYWGLAFASYHTENYWWEITTYGEEWQMSLEDFEEELARFEEQGLFDVPLVKAKEYQRNGWCMVYGDEVEYKWLPLSRGDTVVEVYFDVQSEDFLTTGDVSELFYEEFGYEVHIYECGTPYFDAFCINDAGDEYLIPVKEEGLQVEVWQSFVDEFWNEFGVKAVYTELAVKQFFDAYLGYRPEVEIFYWSEEEAVMQISFKHLGGKEYCIDAKYDEFFGWYTSIEELREFAEIHPECMAAPKYNLVELLKMFEFYYNW